MAVSGLSGVSPFRFVQRIVSEGELDQSTGTQGLDFSSVLQGALGQVNATELNAQKAMNDLLTGKSDNIQEVMLAMEKADTTLQFALQVRNKLLDAYSEIMRMQI